MRKSGRIVFGPMSTTFFRSQAALPRRPATMPRIAEASALLRDTEHGSRFSCARAAAAAAFVSIGMIMFGKPRFASAFWRLVSELTTLFAAAVAPQ